MSAQCALPWASPGHLQGLTLQRLFTKVLDISAPNLFVSFFNEHTGGRQPPSQTSKTAFNMGLPNDSQNKQVWVDTYASEFSRDVEPNVEAGDRVFTVLASCVQMYKAGELCNSRPESACCSVSDKEIWSNVWSLARIEVSNRSSALRSGSTASVQPCPSGSIMNLVSEAGDNGSCDCEEFCAADWSG